MRILLLTLLTITLIHSSPWYAQEHQGFQIIDSSLSYMNNLIITEHGLHLRADKAMPNVFTSIVEGALPEGFYLNMRSILKNGSAPFVSFDAFTRGDVDYFVGATFGTRDEDGIGLPLMVASNDMRRSELRYLENIFLYGVVIDEMRSRGDDVYFYAIGWRYTQGDKPGLVVLRGKALIGEVLSVAEIPESDIQLIDGECYDVWAETDYPQMYMSKNGEKLIVGVKGRCDQIFLFTLPEIETQFDGLQYISYDPPFNASFAIDSITYSAEYNRLVYTTKLYNLPELIIAFIDMSQETLTPKSLTNINVNEATPIMAIDETDGSLIIVLGGANTISKYTWKDNTYDFAHPLQGVLPQKLRLATDIIIFSEFIYITTWEADAQIARMPIVNFCTDYCSANGICRSGTCICDTGYEQNPNVKTPECLPTHIINDIDQLRFNSGAVTGFAVLFIFTFFCGAAGWFIWYKRHTQPPSPSRIQYQ